MSMPSETMCKVVVWKNQAVHLYACFFVKAGLEKLSDNKNYFGSDDVSEDYQPIDHAIPGATISMLLKAGIIKGFFDTIPDDKIFGGRRMSKRDKRNGGKINLYSLASRGIAEEFLKRNGMPLSSAQTDLFDRFI